MAIDNKIKNKIKTRTPRIKKPSKSYIKGFEHGVWWALTMAKCETLSLELKLDNILKDDLKEAIKSLKVGR